MVVGTLSTTVSFR